MLLTSFFILVGIVLVAAALSYYHYIYKAKSKTNTVMFLAFLRFCSVFGLLLLLWNPLISSKKYEVQKTPLPILFDNSSSVSELNATKQAQQVYQQLKDSKPLNEKFALSFLQVDSECKSLEDLNFRGKQSRLDLAGSQLNRLYRNQKFPALFISDGNQTSGNDFVYSFGTTNPVYPVALGDTLSYFDSKIDQVNVNKYAFYQNKFPVEVQLSYNGDQACTAQVQLKQGTTVVFSNQIALKPTQKSVMVTALLPANKMGSQLFQAIVRTPKTEKNTTNNTKKFVVDVLDQRRKVAIVSSLNHPDISAFKRAIEHNGQSKVTLLKPSDINVVSDFDVWLLYQPTARFLAVFQQAKKSKTPIWVITGKQTDFTFLNQQQTDLNFKMSAQPEEYLPKYSAQFNSFALDDLGFDSFPPLQNPFGTVEAASKTATVLYSKIQGVETQQPLLVFAEGAQRAAYLIGENSWKWRLYYHTQANSYEKYDVFVDKIIQYLASTAAKKSLVVDFEHFYNAGEELSISAQYFTKNYEFDEKARLQVTVVNKKTKASKQLEMLKSTNYFKANLTGLAAGSYSFTVKELNSNAVFSGNFDVLDFEIEKQFVNSNTAKMQQLADLTSGVLYYPNQINQLIDFLLKDPQYQPIQKEVIKKTPLLDWVFLLILIVVSFATEWFVRKYNGLL